MKRPHVILAILVVATALGSPAKAFAQSRAWVLSQSPGEVSVIDVPSRLITASITSGFNGAVQVAITPEGSKAYVVNAQPSARGIQVHDTATLAHLTHIDLLPTDLQTQKIVFSPINSRAYLANHGGFNLHVLDTSSDTLLPGPIPLCCNRFFGLDIAPDGSRLYAVNFVPAYNRGVVAIDIATETETPLSGAVMTSKNSDVAFTPDGVLAYVTGFDTDTVYVIETATDATIASIPVGTQPVGVTITPDGSLAYVSNNLSDDVSVIDTYTNLVIATVPVGTGPERGIEATPDGTEVWVPNFGAPFETPTSMGSVSVISTATHTVVDNIVVPPGAISIDFEPLAAPLQVLVDIKPGDETNSFNNNGNGVLPVAILGAPDFDVTLVDPSTVELEGMAVRAVGKKNPHLQAHLDDVNGDGITDLVMQIEDEDGVFEPGESTAILTGELYDGTKIEGEDLIRIVGQPSS